MTRTLLPAVLLACVCSYVEAKPNILFIMSDDHTTQAVGAYGSRLAKVDPTPVIDSLAKNGMRFDRVFCNNSICVPSRASIITGQYSQRNGIIVLGGQIPPERQYLAIEMKKAGYSTAMVGKWHLSAEPAAFDFYCVLPGQGKYHNPDFHVRGDKPWRRNKITRSGQHSSDAITDISLEWLKNGRDKNKPFFLMHHFKAPHDMFQNAKRYNSYLEDVDIPEPDNLHNQPADGFGSVATRKFGAGVTKAHPSWGLPRKLGVDPKLQEPEHGKLAYQKYLKRYLRCVKGVDDNVKRLLDYLGETGELENTVLMYTGDQGFFLGEHDLMDKRWMYEEGMRMPFIVHWPKGVKKGQVNDWLINNTDFAPTILELAGAEKTPDYMQGRSFAAAVNGDKKPDDWRKVTYYRYWMHMAHSLKVPAHFGIRSDRYKLILFYGLSVAGTNPTPVAWEFYDLEKDPFEMKNEYNNPEYKQLIAGMKEQLKTTRKELGEEDKNPKILEVIEKHWDD
ncbi:MAG: sulfatase [Kiritimatiellia bacterium]|jgi:arylsulfatase A-like enzyme|nr:sulfatase [Kiritimatiellia bacterium]MDP6847212.1 sulfatase [Kiritimatiellia bacterium]